MSFYVSLNMYVSREQLNKISHLPPPSGGDGGGGSFDGAAIWHVKNELGNGGKLSKNSDSRYKKD